MFNATSLPVPLPPHEFPWYHISRPHVFGSIPDSVTGIAAPFLVYWVYSLVFYALERLELPFFERYRIHEPDDIKNRNRVTLAQVIKAVLIQQALQTALGLAWLENDDSAHDYRRELDSYASWTRYLLVTVLGRGLGTDLAKLHASDLGTWFYWWGVPLLQFFFAAFVLDAWQYTVHRYFHTNKFLYKHVHSVHHRLYVPYAFGALYNHPVEGFVMDTLGAVVAETCARMTTRQAILFFCISTAKTVDDHCGYNLPWDPFQRLFSNNVDYHDLHHQIAGLKHNFSQPYFTNFDILLGTRMTRSEFEARRLAKRSKISNGKAQSTALEASTTSSDAEVEENEVNGPNELASPPTSRRRGLPLKEE